MKKFNLLYTLIFLGMLVAASAQATGLRPNSSKPDGKGGTVPLTEEERAAQAEFKAQGIGRALTQAGIKYHNGPVMLGTTNIYYIWYGNWSGNTATTILPAMASSIGGTPYYNIITTYTNRAGTRLSNSVAYKGSIYENYSFGTSLSDANVASLVYSVLTSQKLPKDANGVYFVLTSDDVDVNASDFCNLSCSSHSHVYIGGKYIKYALVGNPARCPSKCAWQTSTSPNNNVSADAMANQIVSQLVETVTDPQLNAWYDSWGWENAQKCAWMFGTTSKAANGSKYNVTWGGKQYLIQQNWVNAGTGYCAMSF